MSALREVHDHFRHECAPPAGVYGRGSTWDCATCGRVWVYAPARDRNSEPYLTWRRAGPLARCRHKLAKRQLP